MYLLFMFFFLSLVCVCVCIYVNYLNVYIHWLLRRFVMCVGKVYETDRVTERALMRIRVWMSLIRCVYNGHRITSILRSNRYQQKGCSAHGFTSVSRPSILSPIFSFSVHSWHYIPTHTRKVIDYKKKANQSIDEQPEYYPHIPIKIADIINETLLINVPWHHLEIRGKFCLWLHLFWNKRK